MIILYFWLILVYTYIFVYLSIRRTINVIELFKIITRTYILHNVILQTNNNIAILGMLHFVAVKILKLYFTTYWLQRVNLKTRVSEFQNNVVITGGMTAFWQERMMPRKRISSVLRDCRNESETSLHSSCFLHSTLAIVIRIYLNHKIFLRSIMQASLWCSALSWLIFAKLLYIQARKWLN